MYLAQKLKSLEKQIVYIKWADSEEYGKIKYVGNDFIELEIIDTETMSYDRTIIINPNVIVEIEFGGADIGRVIAAVSCMLPSAEHK